MILADGINPAILLGIGLFMFGPLTLLVTAIESLVLQFRLRLRLRDVFGRVLAANLLSTLAGCVLLFIQDGLVYVTVAHESIPAFIRGYRWLAPLLVLGYFAASVLVEGFWLTRRRFLARIDRPGRSVFRGVVLGNVLSYLVMGPLFYLTTRPDFGGVETTLDAKWSHNPDTVIYFADREDPTVLNPEDHWVKRKQIGSDDVTTLVPFCARSFMFNEDESTFVFVSCEGNLCAYRAGDTDKILLREYERGCFISTASISPDGRQVAFRDPPPGADAFDSKTETEPIVVIDLDSRERTEIGTAPYVGWNGAIAWSADGSRIYVSAGGGEKVLEFRAEPPHGPPRTLTSPPPLTNLVINYARARGGAGTGNGWPFVVLPRNGTMGPYSYELNPYMGSDIRIRRGGVELMHVRNNYGLLNVSMPFLRNAAPLPSNDELLLEWWGQCYVLGIESRRLGLAADGDEFVLRSNAFRVTFESRDGF